MYEQTPSHNIIIQFIAFVVSFLAAALPALFVSAFIAGLFSIHGDPYYFVLALVGLMFWGVFYLWFYASLTKKFISWL